MGNKLNIKTKVLIVVAIFLVVIVSTFLKYKNKEAVSNNDQNIAVNEIKEEDVKRDYIKPKTENYVVGATSASFKKINWANLSKKDLLLITKDNMPFSESAIISFDGNFELTGDDVDEGIFTIQEGDISASYILLSYFDGISIAKYKENTGVIKVFSKIARNGHALVHSGIIPEKKAFFVKDFNDTDCGVFLKVYLWNQKLNLFEYNIQESIDYTSKEFCN